MLFESMHPSWQSALADQRPLLGDIERNLRQRDEQILPTTADIMRAFSTTLSSVRVLIVGQDPYPTPGDPIGLAFAVNLATDPRRRLPRSLKNIMTELASDLGPGVSNLGDLSRWQEQGVMLLNRTLTVTAGAPGSHSKIGWHKFTDAAVAALDSAKAGSLVAVLWGNHAAELAPKLEQSRIVRGAHPSPLSASRGFFGTKPFSSVNVHLKELGLEPIDWSC